MDSVQHFCNSSMHWFLENDQRDAQILFYVFISIYNSLHVSSTQCSSSGEMCAHISATNIEWLLPEAVLIQSVSPDDEHYVLETCRVINRNKYIEKNMCITLVIYQEWTHYSNTGRCFLLLWL